MVNNNTPQRFKMEYWSIRQIVELLNKNPEELILRPSFQRRGVWSNRNKVDFIDSIARGVPCGALSLHQRIIQDGQGVARTTWDVIDGQQRIQAIKEFFIENKFQIPPNSNVEERDGIPNTPWSDALGETGSFPALSQRDSRLAESLRGYQFPILYVDDGDQQVGVSTFLRMNKNVVPLNDHEIRHGQFYNMPMTSKLEELSEELNGMVPDGARRTRDRNRAHEAHENEKKTFFEYLGVINEPQWSRMQDYDILTGLAVYAYTGHPADRRNSYKDVYKIPDANEVDSILMKVRNSLRQLLLLCKSGANVNDVSIVHISSNTNKLHHIYDIPGVLILKNPIKRDQEDDLNLRSNIQAQVNGLMATALSYKRDLTTSQTGSSGQRDVALEALKTYTEDVKLYSGTFKGQQNSGAHREDRNRILTKIFESVYNLEPRRNFTSVEKDIIWHRGGEVDSTGNTVRKCSAVPNHCNNRIVSYSSDEDDAYEAGHINPDWNGGLNSPDNGRIECRRCNRRNQRQAPPS